MNFLKSADPENLVFENRTAILKEKVVGTGGIRNFTLMLWVDQAFLPPSDSATIITSDPGLSTPPESEVDLEPELEVIPDPRLLLSTAIEASLVLSIPFNGLNYRVDNPLAVPLLVFLAWMVAWHPSAFVWSLVPLPPRVDICSSQLPGLRRY